MASLYVTEQGAVIHKQGERLLVTKDGSRIKEIPILFVDQVVVFGNVSITTPAISFLLNNGIETVYLSSKGRYRGRLKPEYSKNILLRQRQFKKAGDTGFCLSFAKSIVAGKALNQRNRCLRIMRDRQIDSDSLKDELDIIRSQINTAHDLATLRAVEGEISRRYFAVLKTAFEEDFKYKSRSRRPPTDPVNTVLSFSYTLLKNAVFAAVSTVGLDPYQGYYHACKHGRPSLVLDLMEEFRPIISDAVAQGAINKKEIKITDFTINQDAVSLSDEGIKKIIGHFNEKLSAEFEHLYFNYRVDYRRCIELQARLFAKCVLGELAEYHPYIAR